MASAMLATTGAMRSGADSIRSAGPAALIAATGWPVWLKTAAPQQAVVSVNWAASRQGGALSREPHMSYFGPLSLE